MESADSEDHRLISHEIICEVFKPAWSRGVAWVIGARGGLQFCRPKKSWDVWWVMPRYHPHFRPLLIVVHGGPPFTPSLRHWCDHHSYLNVTDRRIDAQLSVAIPRFAYLIMTINYYFRPPCIVVMRRRANVYLDVSCVHCLDSVISRAPGLKLVVQTLLSSLRPIGNIVLICCTFFIIFGILGLQVPLWIAVSLLKCWTRLVLLGSRASRPYRYLSS